MFFGLVLWLVLLMPGVQAQGEEILMVSGDFYPPYIWFDEDGKARGLSADILEAIEKEMDIHINLVSMDFARALEEVKEGRAQAINVIFHTDERARYLQFSHPVLQSRVMVYKKRGLPIEAIDEITPYLIGALEGDASMDLLREQVSDVRFKTFSTAPELFSALKEGAVEVFVFEEIPGQYYLTREGILYDFRTITSIDTQSMFFGVSREETEVLSLLNEGLARIDIEEIAGGYIASVDSGFPPWLQRVLFFTFGGLLLLIALFLSINAVLRRMVREKTRELQATNEDLQASYEEIEAMNEELVSLNKDLTSSLQMEERLQRNIDTLLTTMSMMVVEDADNEVFLREIGNFTLDILPDVAAISFLYFNPDQEGATLLYVRRDHNEIQLGIPVEKGLDRKQLAEVMEEHCQLDGRFHVFAVRYQGQNFSYIGYKLREGAEEGKLYSLLGRVADSIVPFLALRDFARKESEFHRRMVLALSEAMGYYDDYTCRHSERIAQLTADFARFLGYGNEDIKRLYWAGILHDVGKMVVPQTLLNKANRLTPEEFSVIKQHPIIGHNLTANAQLPELTDIILYHHERWDGQGYPHGLKGEDIPELARLVAIVDAYDAMRSQRPYSQPLSGDEAVREVQRCSGTQFDPRMASAFIRFLNSQEREIG